MRFSSRLFLTARHSEDRAARFTRFALRVARKSGAVVRAEESRRRNGENLGPRPTNLGYDVSEDET